MILANLRPAQHSTPLSYFLSVQLGHWLRTAGTSPRFGRAQARPYTEEDYPMDGRENNNSRLSHKEQPPRSGFAVRQHPPGAGK